MNKKGLKQKALAAVNRVVIGHFLSQIIRFCGNLILTRLLVPEMFGVMAIVNVIMIGLTMLSDIGMLQIIVQSKRSEEVEYLNTAWTIQIIRGGIKAILLLIISLSLFFLNEYNMLSTDTVYANPILPNILLVMMVVPIVAGFNSIYLMLLNKKLMQGRLVFIDLVSQIVGLLFMVSLAFYNKDIWSLVFGVIVSTVIKTLLSHSSLIGQRCRIGWDKEAFYEIFHFGKWMQLSSIFSFFVNQGDRLLLSSFVKPELLGVYTVAYFLATAVKEILMKLISSVFYPVLSETVRNNPNQLPNVYYKIRSRIDLITMFSAGFLYEMGGTIVEFFYDSRYQEAGWMLEILSLSLVGVGFMLSSKCFLAIGNSKLESLLNFIQLVSLYSIVPAMYHYYGTVGAIWAISLYSVVRILVSMVLMKKYLFLNIIKEFCLLPMIMVGWLLGYVVNNFLLNLRQNGIDFILS